MRQSRGSHHTHTMQKRAKFGRTDQNPTHPKKTSRYPRAKTPGPSLDKWRVRIPGRRTASLPRPPKASTATTPHFPLAVSNFTSTSSSPSPSSPPPSVEPARSRGKECAMGRGKVVLQRIDDKTVRKVTFSKRRQGLFKKARELSVLCGAEVAALVFSSTRRSYNFSHPGSIEVIVQRYHEHNLSQDDHQIRLKGGVNILGILVYKQYLQTTLGFFMNLSIEGLNLSELAHLECQLHEILKEIIDWKNQMIEKSNNILREKVEAAALLAEKEVMNEDAL